MKNTIIILTSFFALLLLNQCNPQIAPSENINREWMLVEFQDFKKDFLVKNKAKLDLTKTTNPTTKFTANMGCNGMFGNVNFSAKGKVKFSEIGSTEMFCADNMNLESEFGKILPTINNYKIEGHFLTLKNKDGEIMKFVAADWD